VEDCVSLEFYKIMHVFGIALLICGLAGLWGVSLLSTKPIEASLRRRLALIHGLGMTLVLVGGFGMLARLGIMGNWPGWVYAKLVIWVVFGASLVLAKRKARWGSKLLLFWAGLVGFATYLALLKPF
jgi:uncharacterized membrane protein SirB2